MKLQLDTQKKTIKVEGEVKIADLLQTLKKLFPNKEYEKFTLITETVINNWNSPVIIERKVPYYPYYPRYCGTTHNSLSAQQQSQNNAEAIQRYKELSVGIYNVETK